MITIRSRIAAISEWDQRTRCYAAVFIVAVITLLIFYLINPLANKESLFDTLLIHENKNYANEQYPKVVNQIWFNYKNSPNPPADWQEASDKTKKINPGWEFKVWTDEAVRDMFKESFPWFLETFDSYEYNIERVDAAKYFIMQKHGGVYLDWDEVGKISFDELIQKHNLSRMECMMPAGTPNGITNYVMMCKKESPFFSYMTARMRYYHGWYGIPYATVMWSTGPRFVSARYAEYTKNQKRDIYILPGETVKAYFECLFGQSWFSWDGYIIHAFSYPFIRLGVPWKFVFILPLSIVIGISYCCYSKYKRRAQMKRQMKV